jgi:Arc/MetJ-type ribon-helix-helix transcriptional regulator
MNLEIHKPELVQRVQAQIQSGHFHDTDELIEKALDALEVQVAAASSATATSAVVLAALQASPYRDIDLMPPRVCLTNVRDVPL